MVHPQGFRDSKRYTLSTTPYKGTALSADDINVAGPGQLLG